MNEIVKIPKQEYFCIHVKHLFQPYMICPILR